MQESFFRPLDTDGEGNVILSVQECHALISDALGRLTRVRVRGELSKPNVVRGAMAFFDLKDAGGKEYVLECALFGLSFQRFRHLLEDGMEVVLTARPDLYKTGRLRLLGDSLEPYGEGAWKRAFEALKKKLAAKGYFAEERKRAIPKIVHTIGLITSEEGQAMHDFRRNLGEYGFRILFYPVWVEGDLAEKSIVQAFQWFNHNRPDTDVLVLIRGGGGFENLKVFHSEKIADSIVSSRIPVITGIGHEKDESIADHAADKSVSTPTAAAVFLRTQREELMRLVDVLGQDLQTTMQDVLEDQRHAIDTQAERLYRGFGRVFEGFRNLQQRLVRAHYAYEKQLYAYVARVERAQSMLVSLSPEHVLQRGYSITLNSEGTVLKSYKQAAVGEEVFVRLKEGGLSSRVERKSQVSIFKSQTNSNDSKS